MIKVPKTYQQVWLIFRKYVAAYGGARQIFLSPYFHAALLLNMALYGKWFGDQWFSQPLSILPDLVGFTLGGYAILLAFGDEKFRKKLSGGSEDGKHSPFLRVSATFAHYIVVQAAALLLAVAADGGPSIRGFEISLYERHLPLGKLLAVSFGFVGHLVFLYALLLTLAATMGVYRVTTWYDKAPK